MCSWRSHTTCLNKECSFSGYSWKLPAYNGVFLLTVVFGSFLLTTVAFLLTILALSGTKIASQNRSDHGGRKRARNHSMQKLQGFFASPAEKKR